MQQDSAVLESSCPRTLTVQTFFTNYRARDGSVILSTTGSEIVSVEDQTDLPDLISRYTRIFLASNAGRESP